MHINTLSNVQQRAAVIDVVLMLVKGHFVCLWNYVHLYVRRHFLNGYGGITHILNTIA